MGEGGVRFPVGPHSAISWNFRLARAVSAGFGGQKIKVIPRLFVVNKKPLVQNSAVRADFFEVIFYFRKITFQNFIYMISGKIISKNIKKLRAKLGLTQDDLAKKADIKYTTLIKVEGGSVNKPSVQTMAKIAKAFDVSIEDLLK